uniref:A-kinase anchor 110kDa C-terminal domain-containing protein n=1 Tax=Pelusios castaneus TaxID=367368 RepID=A0A8C8VP70_9SAUR
MDGGKECVVSWLSNDLQKYAVGFQHALTPSDAPQKRKGSETRNDPSLSQNSDTSLKSTGAQKGKRDPDDVSYFVNKLCSLVVQMARKEITDKLEGTANKFIRQGIHGSAGEGKNNNPRGSVSKIASQMVNEAVEASTQDPHSKLPSPRASQEKTTRREDTSGSKKTSLFYGEMSNQNGSKQGGKPGDKQMCQQAKQSWQDDSGTSVSKGLMVYANQVASDMMFSFMKTMKVQRKDGKPLPACVVLKRVILKHTKDVISDLIDSTMKNLHNVTGVLMTDSDFVSTVKKNLYNIGSQKSTEILEAMVKRLFKALAGDDKQSRSQSLAYTSLKTGSQDTKSQGMQFTAMKSEICVYSWPKNANSSSQNKELQAILQWMAASHFNVPNLSFMNENEGDLKKLPQLAEKASKKGYSVGDILQEVMRYFEKQQIDAAVGNVPRCGLLDWLLANL